MSLRPTLSSFFCLSFLNSRHRTEEQRFKDTLLSIYPFCRLPHDLDDRRPPAAPDAPSPAILGGRDNGPPRAPEAVPVTLGLGNDDAAAARAAAAAAVPKAAVGADVAGPDGLRLRGGLRPQDDRGGVPAAAVPLPQEMRQHHRSLLDLACLNLDTRFLNFSLLTFLHVSLRASNSCVLFPRTVWDSQACHKKLKGHEKVLICFLNQILQHCSAVAIGPLNMGALVKILLFFSWWYHPTATIWSKIVMTQSA